MNSAISWSLGVAAVAAGYLSYGWRGVALAVTVIVFWLLLQFSRALRTLRAASARPIGAIDNAVMLQAQLHEGMRLMHIIKLTRSLGTPVHNEAETLRWCDAAGDAVRVEMKHGKVARWVLERVPPAQPPTPPP